MKKLKEFVKKLINFDKIHYKRLSAAGSESSNPWIRKASNIGGWLFEGEPELLYELSRSAPDGNFIEIGCWMGKSTCILAGGMADSNKTGKILCIDPFTLEDTPEQIAYHRRVVGHMTGTFNQFIGNAKAQGFYERIVPVAAFSAAAFSVIQTSATFAFIDGAHDYENAKRDFELIFPALAAGSCVAFHDVGTPQFPDLPKLMSELKERPDIEYVTHVGSIEVLRKV